MGLDDLLVGATSRHSLDRLNTSNDFQKNKYYRFFYNPTAHNSTDIPPNDLVIISLESPCSV